MTKHAKNLKTNPNQSVAATQDAKEKFKNQVIKLNSFTFEDILKEDFNADKCIARAKLNLEVLNTTSGIQEMLGAQLLSIHRLQQTSIMMAIGLKHLDGIQYYTNAAIKLANCFTQQANLLAKLQGGVSQKITIERVDVHHGGQAIVGDINQGVPTTHQEKK